MKKPLDCKTVAFSSQTQEGPIVQNQLAQKFGLFGSLKKPNKDVSRNCQISLPTLRCLLSVLFLRQKRRVGIKHIQ